MIDPRDRFDILSHRKQIIPLDIILGIIHIYNESYKTTNMHYIYTHLGITKNHRWTKKNHLCWPQRGSVLYFLTKILLKHLKNFNFKVLSRFHCRFHCVKISWETCFYSEYLEEKLLIESLVAIGLWVFICSFPRCYSFRRPLYPSI